MCVVAATDEKCYSLPPRSEARRCSLVEGESRRSQPCTAKDCTEKRSLKQPEAQHAASCERIVEDTVQDSLRLSPTFSSNPSQAQAFVSDSPKMEAEMRRLLRPS